MVERGVSEDLDVAMNHTSRGRAAATSPNGNPTQSTISNPAQYRTRNRAQCRISNPSVGVAEAQRGRGGFRCGAASRVPKTQRLPGDGARGAAPPPGEVGRRDVTDDAS
eukprot:gene14131-biopygen6168